MPESWLQRLVGLCGLIGLAAVFALAVCGGAAINAAGPAPSPAPSTCRFNQCSAATSTPYLFYVTALPGYVAAGYPTALSVAARLPVGAQVTYAWN